MPSKLARILARSPLTLDALWALERLGQVALAPDGERAVFSVATPSMADNKLVSSLWITSTQADAKPQRLTRCGDKDGQPSLAPS